MAADADTARRVAPGERAQITLAGAPYELLLHSAAAFVLIVLLLALAFGHSRHVLLVLLSLPSTLIGGVAAVALTGGTLTLRPLGAARTPALESGHRFSRRRRAPDSGVAHGIAHRTGAAPGSIAIASARA